MVTVYSTCPSSHNLSGARFRERIVDVARWTEAAGCRGLLVYTDNTLVDPWAAAQLMIDKTESLVPLVAVQPVYMHPFTVARMISTIGFLYGRSVDLNLVTGGYGEHLRALGDILDHDERYHRLGEYGKVINRLLTGTRPITHLGDFFSLNAATITPPLPAELAPRLFLSGSSEASREVCRAMGAVRLAYPRAIHEYDDDPTALVRSGIRLGIIARDTSEEAWRVAHHRFPSDQVGEQFHDMAEGLVESHWHKRLSVDARQAPTGEGTYWMYPFRTYKTFCPYLVGSYAEVAAMLRRYLDLGVATIILDVPQEADDLYTAGIALREAAEVVAAP
jgi:alkanesulfonate monooxygenase